MTQKVFNKCKAHFINKNVTRVTLYKKNQYDYDVTFRFEIKVINLTDTHLTIKYGAWTGLRKSLKELEKEGFDVTDLIFDMKTICLHRKDIRNIEFY